MKISKHIDPRTTHPLTLLHKLTIPLISPQRRYQRCLSIRVIVNSHDLLNSFCSFLGVVERDGRYKVMKNVSTGYMVKEVAIDNTEIAVDGSSGTSSESPLVVGEMR